MKKKIISLTIILAMILGASAIAMANDSADTQGEIRFKDGEIIILPPGEDCCHCYCPDCGDGCAKCDGPCPGGCSDPEKPHGPGEPCDCPCHDATSQFKNFNVGENLFFSTWTIGRGGIFDSFDEAQTTAAGKTTGVQVINQTSGIAKISVEVSQFVYEDQDAVMFEGNVQKPFLKGADLTLVQRGNAANLPGFSPNPALVQGTEIKLLPDGAAMQILTTPAGSAVKASWSGLLDVVPGTALWVGSATAVLTWTDISGTP